MSTSALHSSLFALRRSGSALRSSGSALRSSGLALTGLLLAAPAVGCSDLGTHSLAIEGNDAVTSGIAMTATDGWEISFDTFLVVVHDPAMIERTDNKPTWVRENGVTVWNVVTAVEGEQALTTQIRATRYDGAQFRIAPTSANGYEAEPGNATGEDVDAAVADGWSIKISGSASTGMDSKLFEWTFDTNTLYRCKFEGDEVLELEADGDETTTIEILGDALFRSDVDDPASALAFQPIADADADNDGMITTDELDAAGLLDQITALTRQLGGVRGAGACPELDTSEEG